MTANQLNAPFSCDSKSRADDFTSSHSRIPAVRRWLIAGIAGLLFAGSSSTSSVRAAEQVTLAGSFNNWAAADDAYSLKPTGKRLEIVRFWQCGVYEFKFVFDGSWQRHLGDAGGGRLDQPGGNIPLTIQQSGEYAIWLDVEGKRWGLEPRKPDRPHARIRVIEPWGGSPCVDGSLSLARADHPITRYEWQVWLASDSSVKPKLTQSRKTDGAKSWLNIDRPGQYHIRLLVSDGEKSDEAQTTQELGYGFELDAFTKNGQGEPFSRNMSPLDAGRWYVPIGILGENDAALIVRRIGSGAPARDEAKLQAHLTRPAAGRSWAVYDERIKKLVIRSEGIVFFICAPNRDERLPKGLQVEEVDLVGSFNNWQPRACPIFAVGEGSVFIRCVELPDGLHAYKLLINGSLRLEDLDADKPLRQPDGNGGYNSGYRVGPDPSTFGTPKPGHVECGAVEHDPQRPQDFSLISKGLAKLTVRTLHDDVQEVDARIEGRERPVPLRKVEAKGGFDYWSACCSVNGSPLKYGFDLVDAPARSQLDRTGCHPMRDESGAPASPQVAPFVADMKMSFETPEWAKQAVWYQIFPERFCNGDLANDPPRTVPWTHEWYKPYNGKRQKQTSKGQKAKTSKLEDGEAGGFQERGTFFDYIFDRRYGGDIQGIRQRLPYLRDLGVTAIYLNPIFLAESMHKYDGADYRHIDDFFGVKGSLAKITGETTDPATWKWSESDRVFLDFLKEAHRMGFKVVIDGVFNHVGRGFWAFQDVLKNGEKSPYAGWFDVESFKPFHYLAWDKKDGTLPRLKHDDALGLAKPVREHIFAITRRWMDPNGDGDSSDGIDGWRLDVAGDINANFWRDWRKLVKSTNPDAIIIAELWQESRQWLDGQTFDAVMNYPFAVRCQRFFVNKKKAIGPAEFQRQLQDVLGWYTPQVNYALQNLFDSHDTDRVASMFMNPDLEYDQANRQQDNGPKYNPKKPTAGCYRKLKLAVTFQMTYLGAPMIYYGDEAGMYGADDPSCRKPMLWADLMPYDDSDERIEPDVFEHYRRMVALRNTHRALQVGSFDPISASDSTGLFAYARRLDDQEIVVVLNNSDQTHRLDVPVEWSDGTAVVRLDDPRECEIVAPPNSAATARPTARPIAGRKPSIRVEAGRLRGANLGPRSAAILLKAS